MAISCEGIAEIDGARRVVFIPRNEIKEVEFRFGSAAENPAVQCWLGALMIGTGLIFAKGIIRIILFGGILYFKSVGLLILPAIGAWLLWDVLRKQGYLKVRTSSETRKIVFRGKVDAALLAQFINEVNQNFGYEISIPRS